MIMGVDIEIYSSVDLVKAGTRPYTEAPDFTILLIGYKVDELPTRIIDLTSGVGEAITLLPVTASDLPAGDLDEFLCLLTDPEVTKTAYNAAFERTCLARYFDRPMPPEQWRCTMVQAATLGLPGTLAQVGAALGLACSFFISAISSSRSWSFRASRSKSSGFFTAIVSSFHNV